MVLDFEDPDLQTFRVVLDMESRARKRELQAKWAGGLGAFFVFGPGPIAIAALDIFFGWAPPLTTPLEFIIFCWAGPGILLFLLANWLDRESKRLDYEAIEARFQEDNLRIVVPRTRIKALRQGLDALVQTPEAGAGSSSQRELRELHELICRQIDTGGGHSIS